ncbi:MAG: bifunctional nuclease family protein [Trueperaceae bacterium]
MVKATLEDVAVSNDGDSFMVLLSTEKGSIVPIAVGALEAMSIAQGRAKEKFPRPLTHDLMLSVFGILNVSVKRIEISELRDNTFFAKLIIENRGIEFEIDARPSDALALAVRSEAPLFIDAKVVERSGISEFSKAVGGVEA